LFVGVFLGGNWKLEAKGREKVAWVELGIFEIFVCFGVVVMDVLVQWMDD